MLCQCNISKTNVQTLLCMVAYFTASQTQPQNSFRDTVIVCVADAFTAFYGGLVVFSILGFLAKETGKPIEQFATSGMVTRIFNSCEVLIETWVTVWNHEACRGMPNSYLSDGIFNLHRKTIMDFFLACSSFGNCI